MTNGKSYVGLLACPRCGETTGVALDRRLRDTFEDGKLYAGDLCPKCQNEVKEISQIARNGGLAFKCEECGIEGAIRPDGGAKEFCDMVRHKQFGHDDPEWQSKPLGLIFEKCDEHEWLFGKDGKQETGDEPTAF
jgi:predicted RNA-binding Zn-ribbon protein involved in translation (DUF1610 family)